MGLSAAFSIRCASLGIPLLAIAGNVDRPLAISYLRRFEDAGLLRMLDLQPYRLVNPRDPADAVYLAGFALVTPSPFRVKDHERRDLASDTYAGPLADTHLVRRSGR